MYTIFLFNIKWGCQFVYNKKLSHLSLVNGQNTSTVYGETHDLCVVTYYVPGTGIPRKQGHSLFTSSSFINISRYTIFYNITIYFATPSVLHIPTPSPDDKRCLTYLITFDSSLYFIRSLTQYTDTFFHLGFRRLFAPRTRDFSLYGLGLRVETVNGWDNELEGFEVKEVDVLLCLLRNRLQRFQFTYISRKVSRSVYCLHVVDIGCGYS